MTTAPAGWYEDSQLPGSERWWDGEAWTDHRRSRLAPAATVCPVCCNVDAVQRMSVAIDSGFTSTSGSAGILVGGGLGYARFNSSSVTSLAARIAPPSRPRFAFARVFAIWWLVGTLLSAVWVAAQTSVGGAWFVAFAIGLWTAFVTWIPALVIALLAKVFSASTYATRQLDWDRKAEELRSAYYCARDDVVFSGDYAATPEAYRASIFLR